jgi:FkbM family methyltransferase
MGLGAKQVGREAARLLTSTVAARRLLRAASLRGLLPPAVWSRLPVEATFAVPSSDRGRFLYASIAADNIGRSLFWRELRSWEPESVAVFVPLARRALTFVDVGANTGVFTLIACAENPRLRAMAFEPVPHIHDALRNNLAINHLGDRCVARAEAVSDAVGQAELHVPHGTLPTSASLDPEGFRGYRGTKVDVAVTTIDIACHDFPTVDLVKIDVEGFEDRVLAGMPAVLDRSEPAIVVECNPDGPYRAVETILRRHRYRFFHLRDQGAVARESIEPDATEAFRNYLCLPPSKLAWLPAPGGA